MLEFFRDRLHVAADGNLHINELILAAIVVVALVLLVVLIVDLAKKGLSRMPGRRTTIFSHRKNPYKDRINKKRKFGKNKRRGG